MEQTCRLVSTPNRPKQHLQRACDPSCPCCAAYMTILMRSATMASFVPPSVAQYLWEGQTHHTPTGTTKTACPKATTLARARPCGRRAAATSGSPPRSSSGSSPCSQRLHTHPRVPCSLQQHAGGVPKVGMRRPRSSAVPAVRGFKPTCACRRRRRALQQQQQAVQRAARCCARRQ